MPEETGPPYPRYATAGDTRMFPDLPAGPVLLGDASRERRMADQRNRQRRGTPGAFQKAIGEFLATYQRSSLNAPNVKPADLIRDTSIPSGQAPTAKPRKRKYGPAPNLERHRKIAAIAKQYGNGWSDHLPEICKELDREKVHRPGAPAWSRRTRWSALLDESADKYRDRVYQAIKYSLNYLAARAN
jgi:hypothetical protein